ncbi:hypothetical protein M231_04055 [Tremella mesenterica]|uniref:Uncharacterized protein n=1 Tax=Tremella mesenterica TaxID=5217 RepID=A0A4Q1BLI1_TREME|nr:hypothetical protein M231_04055 [Tremella mesenterica]
MTLRRCILSHDVTHTIDHTPRPTSHLTNVSSPGLRAFSATKWMFVRDDNSLDKLEVMLSDKLKVGLEKKLPPTRVTHEIDVDTDGRVLFQRAGHLPRDLVYEHVMAWAVESKVRGAVVDHQRVQSINIALQDRTEYLLFRRSEIPGQIYVSSPISNTGLMFPPALARPLPGPRQQVPNLPPQPGASHQPGFFPLLGSLSDHCTLDTNSNPESDRFKVGSAATHTTNTITTQLVAKIASSSSLYIRPQLISPVSEREIRDSIQQETRTYAQLSSLQGKCVGRWLGTYQGRLLYRRPEGGSWKVYSDFWICLMDRLGGEVARKHVTSAAETILQSYSAIHSLGVLHNDVDLRHVRLPRGVDGPAMIMALSKAQLVLSLLGSNHKCKTIASVSSELRPQDTSERQVVSGADKMGKQDWRNGDDEARNSSLAPLLSLAHLKLSSNIHIHVTTQLERCPSIPIPTITSSGMAEALGMAKLGSHQSQVVARKDIPEPRGRKRQSPADHFSPLRQQIAAHQQRLKIQRLMAIRWEVFRSEKEAVIRERDQALEHVGQLQDEKREWVKEKAELLKARDEALKARDEDIWKAMN